eukprot:4697620-Lingulodinium_polyedra.AAC.1
MAGTTRSDNVDEDTADVEPAQPGQGLPRATAPQRVPGVGQPPRRHSERRRPVKRRRCPIQG